MNTTLYLTRIGYSGSLKPSLQVLRELQQAHLYSIPFENLDIHHGIPIELDIDRTFKKVILDKRGGFCYELNSLFYELLKSLGFTVKMISARVFDKTNGYGNEYDHMAILVNINGIDYLSDVGFGEFAFVPLKMETGTIQNDNRADYRIEKHDQHYYRVSRLEDASWRPEYIFTTTERELDEFNEMCIYHQTNPASHFTQKILITRPTQTGRITLSGNTLRIRHNTIIEEINLENEEAVKDTLLNYFTIELKPSH